jgi:hypothetical protein
MRDGQVSLRFSGTAITPTPPAAITEVFPIDSGG